jgi:hypothetical protein
MSNKKRAEYFYSTRPYRARQRLLFNRDNRIPRQGINRRREVIRQ